MRWINHTLPYVSFESCLSQSQSKHGRWGHIFKGFHWHTSSSGNQLEHKQQNTTFILKFVQEPTSIRRHQLQRDQTSVSLPTNRCVWLITLTSKTSYSENNALSFLKSFSLCVWVTALAHPMVCVCGRGQANTNRGHMVHIWFSFGELNNNVLGMFSVGSLFATQN